jgi:MFS family permease
VLSHDEIRTIVFGLMLAMFLAALNQTIVATALPTIGRDFRDFELLPWIVTAYLLSSTVVAPLYGKLSDIHGRRAMMLASIGIFTAGSVACAVAPDMIMLTSAVVCRGSAAAVFFPWRNPFLPTRSRRASAAATRHIWEAFG